MGLFTKTIQPDKQVKSKKKGNNPAGIGGWKPGQSGNPKGRLKKGETLTDVLKEHLDKDELAEKLIAIADKGSIVAIKYIYDRIDGAPGQRISVDTGLEKWVKAFEDVK